MRRLRCYEMRVRIPRAVGRTAKHVRTRPGESGRDDQAIRVDDDRFRTGAVVETSAPGISLIGLPGGGELRDERMSAEEVGIVREDVAADEDGSVVGRHRDITSIAETTAADLLPYEVAADVELDQND